MNLTVSTYVSYFKTVAINNKLLLHTDIAPHFFALDIETILGSERHDFTGKALVIEDISGKLSDALSDNIRDYADGAFMVVQPIDKKNTTLADQIQIFNDCLVICKQIISKMRKDRRNRYLSGLDMNSFMYHKVNNVLGGASGYRVTFQFNQPAGVAFNTDEWNNEIPQIG